MTTSTETGGESRLTAIRPLTQDERILARESARSAIRARIGSAPTPEQYATERMAKYPPALTAAIAALCIVVLLAAFVLSAMRLYHAGRDTFTHGIPSPVALSYIAGGVIVILAETAQLVSALALSQVEDRNMRIALYVTAVLATAIAIVGNVHIAKPFNAPVQRIGAFAFAPHAPITWGSAFAWLEAVAPPLIVLSMSHVLKAQMLDAFASHHASHHAYTSALDAWNAAQSAAPEAHVAWRQVLANALRDALIAKNRRIAGARDALNALTNADWRALVWRELDADAWYDERPHTHEPATVAHNEQRALPDAAHDSAPIERITHSASQPPIPSVVRIPVQRISGASGGARTGALDGAVVQNADGTYTGTCPHCGRTFDKPTHSGAINALSAHVGRFCEVAKAQRMSAPDAVVVSANGVSDHA